MNDKPIFLQTDLQTGAAPGHAKAPMRGSIIVQGVSKTYRMYAKPFDRFKEALFRRSFHQPFYSLRDVSFSVNPGESVGIIGENGAGKSTLLKLIAGTLSPSQGTIQLGGRVAALLELGASFHPEFTGRQNIYLNGALLGLTDREIRLKESEIIEFAELGLFVDQPVKTYSSGMTVRLAFSIATSVDPDVLVIDEALSVGDLYFQEKCIRRMMEFQRSGKTILFCSHAMYTVNLLCRRAIWLHKGVVRMDGPSMHVTAAYESYVREQGKAKEAEQALEASLSACALPPVSIRSVKVNGKAAPLELPYKEKLEVTIECHSDDEHPYCIAVGIRRNDGLICHAVNLSRDLGGPFSMAGPLVVSVIYPSLPFFHGEYFVVASVLDKSGFLCYHKMESAPITILPPSKFQNEVGLLDIPYTWKVVENTQTKPEVER